MPLTPATRIGPYEIVSPLGAGGMGEVYRAHDSKLGRDVALKILPPAFAADPERVARFQREAQVLASLNHPHIAALYGLEDSGGTVALVMELVSGPTLADRIRQGPMAVEEALPIAREIAEAVEAAHEKGIVHRDLKPANIKLTAEDRVKVLDFGLAKALGSDGSGESSAGRVADSPTLTMSATRGGMILGTAAYMAPEQAKGKSVDRRADIWAFGVVLMEMLTGKPLYAGETAAETLAAVLMKEPAVDGLPSTVPAPIRALLRRMLEKDPRRRLRDIGEARIAIEDVLSGAVEPAPAVPKAIPPKRALLPWIVAAVACAAAVAVSFLHLREPVVETHAVRFSLHPPPKAHFGLLAMAGPIVVSPDGLRVTYVGALTGGQGQLWIQPFDSLTPQALPGTEGASYPFWSDDSRFIAFFADGKLKRVAVTGGPPQPICAAPSGRGGTWHGGMDGVIVFSPSNFDALYRVAPGGGDPVPITKLDRPAGEISHRQPHFLPGGRHFLYIAADLQIEKGNVWIAELPSGSKPAPVRGKRLMPAYTHVSYAAPGYVLFVRENTLLGQRFDKDKLELAGDPFPLAENIGIFGLRAVSDYSVSNAGVLVYRNSFERAVKVIWLDRQGKEAPVPGGLEVSTPVLSPDGKSLVGRKGNTADGTSGANLWQVDLTRGTVSRFTFERLAQSSPVWSPDGKRIAYGWQKQGPFDVYVRDASGVANPQLVFSSDQDKFPMSWSPDGRWLIFESTCPAGYCIWALPMQNGQPVAGAKPVAVVESSFRLNGSALSPDGRFLAYVSGETGRPEVYVRSFQPESPAGGGKWQVSSGGGTTPVWNRNGKELFLLSLSGQLTVVPVSTVNGFQAGAPEVLFTLNSASPIGAGPGRFYDVSPDGKRIITAVPADEEKELLPTVVLNWTAGLRK